jgi:hypothetical protein
MALTLCMIPLARTVLLSLVGLLSGCISLDQGSKMPIVVGEIEFDPPTIHTVGLSLRILEGGNTSTATVHVAYRQIGSFRWIEAFPLQRVRTDMLSAVVRTPFPIAEQFAGSIFDLNANDGYEVKLLVSEGDGRRTLRTGTIYTRAEPPDNPANPHMVAVDSDRTLAEALSSANPGDVITLRAGTYTWPITLDRNGTVENPIIVRGTSPDRTVLEAIGAPHGVVILASHVVIEDMTIRGSVWGIRIDDADDVVVRHTIIEEVQYGIDGRSGLNRNFYLCDNVLEGNGVNWPDTSSRTWNYEGIVVTGTGHVICHNTLSGFGDALGLSEPTVIPNRAIDFYGNDVLWGGDDGIELDYTERNVRAFRNRLGNVGMGISFQPIWGGPAYAFRNVIYNTANAPYKLNQDPSGFHICHNTSIRSGWAWTQYGTFASNFFFYNNLTVGTYNGVDMTPVIQLAHIDYNGWSPDGQFKFTQGWNGFKTLQEQSPYEHHGILLTQPIFEHTISIPPLFAAFMPPIDDAGLHDRSNAVDAGMLAPNINDHYTGHAPDLGAIERDHAKIQYGVRRSHTSVH